MMLLANFMKLNLNLSLEKYNEHWMSRKRGVLPTNLTGLAQGI